MHVVFNEMFDTPATRTLLYASKHGKKRRVIEQLKRDAYTDDVYEYLNNPPAYFAYKEHWSLDG